MTIGLLNLICWLQNHQIPEQQIEELAAQFHDIYQQEAKRQGDVRHKDAYTDLPENIKEFDRVLARYVIKREAALDALIASAEAKGRLEEHIDFCTICMLATPKDYCHRGKKLKADLEKLANPDNAGTSKKGEAAG